MAEKYSKAQEIKDDISRKCKLCGEEFLDTESYIKHLEGKDHKKQMMKQKYGKKYLEAKAKMDAQISSVEYTEKGPILNSDHSDLEKSSSDEELDIDTEVYPCHLCRKVCTGYLSHELHIKGQKHQKNKAQAKMLKKLRAGNMIPIATATRQAEEDDPLKSFLNGMRYSESHNNLRCDICNVRCTGPAAYKQHFQGEKHKKKVMVNQLLEENGISPPSEGDDSVSIHCEECEKEFTSVVTYEAHMQSNAHLRQVRNLEKLKGLKDLAITSAENSQLTCKECGLVCSGPIPFAEHLRSAAHEKLVKKNNFMKTLEENPSGVVKIPISDDDSDTEETSVYGCSICKKVFSGPESADAHRRSSKHDKAKKRKKQYEKFLAMKNGTKPKKTPASQADWKKTELKKYDDSSDSDDSSDEFEILSKS